MGARMSFEQPSAAEYAYAAAEDARRIAEQARNRSHGQPCPVCGASVLPAYQAQHIAWHDKLRRALDQLEDRVDTLDDNADPAYLSREL